MARPTSGMKTKTRGKRAPGSRLTQSAIDEIFRRFQHLHPHPKTELEYRDPFTLLVAVVLSAQATDLRSTASRPNCFASPTRPRSSPRSARRRSATRSRLSGLYRNKAKNLIALANKLMAEHGGKVPSTRQMLETLPGVGRKTANVVLNVAFGEPTIGVDTHIFRVAQPHRTGARQDPATGRGHAGTIVPDATSTTPITG